MASTGNQEILLPACRGKILIIVENLPVPFDRRVWQEATTLLSAGYEVTVICPLADNAPEAYIELEGVRVYRHPLPVEARGIWAYLIEYPVALYHEFRLAWRVWRKHGFDVIHACNPPDTVFAIGLFFKLFGKKFVFDHHDINPELFEAKFGHRGPFYWALRLVERLTFMTANMSIATNESYRDIAITRGGMSPENVVVVRSGPKLDRLKLQPVDNAQKRGRQFLVGYVGVIGQQEGIDLLIEAVCHLVIVLGRQDIQFTIVGGGPELKAMKTLAQSSGVLDFIHFTGRASDEELLGVLNSADVCVNPDRVNAMNDKSTMNKIMEYMALGKPIVQFELTEGRYSAQEASLYAVPNDPVDLANKIAELLADPDRRARMGSFGRNRVLKELSWDHEIPKLLGVYERIFST